MKKAWSGECCCVNVDLSNSPSAIKCFLWFYAFLWWSLNNILFVNLFAQWFKFVITEIVHSRVRQRPKHAWERRSQVSDLRDWIKIVWLCCMHFQSSLHPSGVRWMHEYPFWIGFHLHGGHQRERKRDSMIIQADSLWCGVKGRHNNEKLLSLINRGHACVHTKSFC